MDSFKRTKLLSIFGAIVISILMAALAMGMALTAHEGQTGITILAVLLLAFAPIPVVFTVFLIRKLEACSLDSEKFATRDQLTGLYNQKTFWDLLNYEALRSTRHKYKFSLLLIDVDNFKIINDKYGHEVGDVFLKDFSKILRAAMRRGDIASRYMGDNFTAILPVCDEEQAYVVAKRIMDSLRTHSLGLPDGSQVQETVSIGVAVYPSHAQDAKDLFLLADSMLGQAKLSGKDHMSFPGEQDNVEMLKNMGEKNIMILDALKSRNKRIVPYFQPIMDVQNGSIMAYEVLTRIIVNGKVFPAADFIEAAENMGVIGKIDYQLIEQTFAKVKAQDYQGTLFLNLSPKAMVMGDFFPTIRALFRDYDINPSNMVFEITERDTVKNIQLIETFVRTLKDDGFRFAIDDFGAGYSSFHYLKSFPIDYLKIDGEFIKNMHGSGTTEREIVSSIASLAMRLQIKTVAEFVESETILDQVRSAGIHYAQGYHIQRPSPELGLSSAFVPSS